MPYCDNTHVLSLDANLAQEGKEILQKKLEKLGFSMHEDVSATEYFPTLGGVIDGGGGCVRSSPIRFWNLQKACEFIATQPVSSFLVQQMLGHAMFALVLNRAGMSIFRSAYDFAGRDYKRKELWGSVKREFQFFQGILPLLVSNMRQP